MQHQRTTRKSDSFTAAESARHRLYEDVLAIAAGTGLVALGLTFYAEATLLTGSTAGLALLLQYGTGASFGLVFFAINLPFYVLAAMRMGMAFMAKTFVSILLVSVLTGQTGRWIDIAYLNPVYAALAGGALMGVGMLILFRHGASLGGINILALFLQDRFAIRAGYFQLAVDVAILLAAFSVIPTDRIALSLLSVVVLNIVLALNHRPGRYAGVS